MDTVERLTCPDCRSAQGIVLYRLPSRAFEYYCSVCNHAWEAPRTASLWEVRQPRPHPDDAVLIRQMQTSIDSFDRIERAAVLKDIDD